MASSQEEIYINFPVAAITNGGPVFPEFADLLKRASSFDGSLRDKVPPFATMAKAGFFSTGFYDVAVCFYCGLRLNHWKKYDSPWLEHLIFEQDCAYLTLNKHRAFNDVR